MKTIQSVKVTGDTSSQTYRVGQIMANGTEIMRITEDATRFCLRDNRGSIGRTVFELDKSFKCDVTYS